ncbi:MAG: hypothetical protein MJ238_00275 [Bacilli bacterium]|nr:hypothetical protein [Bacilli bacterium]
MKKKMLMLVSLLAVASITACGSGDGGDSSSSGSKASTTLSVENDTIPAGGSFFDTCKPTVIYRDKNGNEENMAEYKNMTTYALTDAEGNEYTAGEALKAGKYTATATVKNREGKVEITVEDGNPESGAEGKGYKTYYAKDFEKLAIMKHENTGTLGAGKFPSLGTPKMLVVPVIFKDMEGYQDFTDEEIEVIEKAFFGEANDTSWQSVKSYYYSSSYGNLDIQGEVSKKQFVYSKTVAECERQGSGFAAGVAQSAANWYIREKGLNATDYDYDRDGYIDGINVIYKTTAKDKNDGGADCWWNYTSCVNSQPSLSNPSVHRYFFSAYKYISTPYYTYPNPTIDAHTLIHENGHLIGLNDYYSYDKDDTGTASEAPAGCCDMMDWNVGDHNGYSKMLYNWLRKDASSKGVNLMNIDGSSDNFTLHINSFTDTGDLILIRNTTTDPWNQSPYDEYLIMQYYTPTGVNEGDKNGYGEWKQNTNAGNAGTYEYPGLQVFHVDSRMAVQYGKVEGGKTVSEGYRYFDPMLEEADPIPEKETRFADGTYIGAPIQMTDNTPSRSSYIDENGKIQKDGNVRELSAILSSGVNGLISSSYYTMFGVQSNLFGTKDWAEAHDYSYFAGSNTYSNFRVRDFYMHGEDDLVFNDGSKFNWTVSVESQDETGCTLHFVNNDAIK